MQLVEAIVDYAMNAAGAVSLRALIGPIGMVADVDLVNRSCPYVVVEDSGAVPQYESIGRDTRVEEPVIVFNVYGGNRAEVESVVDAIDAAYRSAELVTTGRVVFSYPRFVNRSKVERLNDRYLGTLSLGWLVENRA